MPSRISSLAPLVLGAVVLLALPDPAAAIRYVDDQGRPTNQQAAQVFTLLFLLIRVYSCKVREVTWSRLLLARILVETVLVVAALDLLVVGARPPG